MNRLPALVHLALLGLSPGLGGCGGAPEAARFVVRDSAGVRIVESVAPAWGASSQWQVDSVPLLDLGAQDGTAFEFDVVADAIRLDDGSVVVADFGSSQLRRFSADGALEWVAGRDGDGPGEFNRIRNLSRLRGDSLLVHDYWIGRATVLSNDGAVGRVFRVGTGGRADQLHPLTDSTFLALFISLELMERSPGLFRIPSPLVRVDREGATLDTIAVLAGLETVILPDGDARPLFGRSVHVAVRNGTMYLGTADRLEFTMHDAAGRLRSVVRVPAADLTLTGDQVAREREALMPPATHPQYAVLRDLAAALPTPVTRPAYARLVVDSEGAVWLEPFRGRSERGVSLPWQVFDATGDWLGGILLPEQLRVRQIGRDFVLGVLPDADGVEHVVVLRLDRS